MIFSVFFMSSFLLLIVITVYIVLQSTRHQGAKIVHTSSMVVNCSMENFSMVVSYSMRCMGYSCNCMSYWSMTVNCCKGDSSSWSHSMCYMVVVVNSGSYRRSSYMDRSSCCQWSSIVICVGWSSNGSSSNSMGVDWGSMCNSMNWCSMCNCMDRCSMSMSNC